MSKTKFNEIQNYYESNADNPQLEMAATKRFGNTNINKFKVVTSLLLGGIQ